MQVERVTAGGCRWRVRRPCRADLNGLIQDPDTFLAGAGSRIVKRNNVRTVHHLRLGRRDYFVKRYERGSFTEQVKALLLESKAAREWRIIAASHAAGLPVPEPAGFAEHRRGVLLESSYLATVAIPDVLDLVPYMEVRLGDDPDARRAFLQHLGRAVRTLHDRGLFHRDLHSGNILVREGPAGEPRIHFIDLHRGSLRRRLGRRARRGNLAFMLHSTSRVTTAAERAAVIRAYAGEDGGGLGDPGAACRWTEARIRRLERRRLRSRTRRCVVKSSAFLIAPLPEGTLYARRDFGVADALAAIAAHRRSVEERRIVKHTARTVVTEVIGAAGRALVVKEYGKRPFEKLTGRAGRRAWLAGNGLCVRGFPAARPLAYLRRRAGDSCLVMERARGRRLDHHVIELARAHGETSRAFRDAIRAAAAAVADLFRALHAQGVYHGDLKACNLYVRSRDGGGVELTLIDYDRVRFADRPLGRRRRIKNLAQLHAAVPRHVSRPARARWFRRYAGAAGHGERRRYYAGIDKACASKIVVDREPIE